MLPWLLIVVLCFVAISAGAAVDTTRRTALLPFDYSGVTLGDGPLKRQFDEVRDYYLRIPNDDLLRGFRQRAGMPAPGADLPGWYSAGTFHVFGQIISGLARMHAATGDIACREKVNTLVSEWGKCIAPDGYFFAGQPNAPHYIYDKMVGGLVDAYVYCHSKQALEYLSRITNWAVKNLDRSNVYGYGYTEWYTLSENLYRAYLATSNRRYKDFAKVWEYTEYWDLYAKKQDILSRIPGIGYYHAYSHVNNLCGAGAAYMAEGDAHYLTVLKNAYDYLWDSQVFCTGGFGPNENLLSREALVRTLFDSHNHFETQCGSWAGFKIGRYLISSTGDARYGDWMERLVLNGIGSSIPTTADGRVFYYADYNVSGGTKRPFDIQWSCCTGTRPIAVADFHNIIYFHSSDSLYVNLYTPSTVKWESKGKLVTLQQRTRFPENPSVEFETALDQPAEFGVCLRVPGWLSEPMTAKINGTPIALKANEHGWAVIRRTWKNGDKLTTDIPLRFWVSRIDPAKQYPAAIMRGPVAMAVRSPNGNPAPRIDLGRLDTLLTSSPGEALTYHLPADSSILVRPFYAFKEGEPYYLYLSPDGTR